MKVQSFGGGVQSVALLRMAIAGKIERPDLVLFADTQQEPVHVYDVVAREREVCAREGIAFETVSRGDLADWRGQKGQVRVPLHTITEGGERGMLFRTCTDKYKIQPIRQRLRALGVKRAELWLGMTVDEIQRVKPSRVGWITNRYPLVELSLRRSDCEVFLRSLGLEAAKSACTFCPYRSTASWRTVREVPADWAGAVAYDESIRDAREGFKSYVHRSCTPLVEAVLEHDDPGLFDEECEGVCAS